jgi:hypothetical protein
MSMTMRAGRFADLRAEDQVAEPVGLAVARDGQRSSGPGGPGAR